MLKWQWRWKICIVDDAHKNDLEIAGLDAADEIDDEICDGNAIAVVAGLDADDDNDDETSEAYAHPELDAVDDNDDETSEVNASPGLDPGDDHSNEMLVQTMV